MMSCWKCGTACADAGPMGPYCPNPACNVFDSVGLSPDAFEQAEAARLRLHERIEDRIRDYVRMHPDADYGEVVRNIDLT